MYSEAEGEPDGDEEFLAALALLRSTEEASAEKLRRLLDASIERKFGPAGRSSAGHSRTSRRLARSSREPSLGAEYPRRDDRPTKSKLEAVRRPSNGEPVAHLATSESATSHGALRVEFDDNFDRGDFPRISIPDEGCGDGASCKVCTGAKLGPLILLECQECQDVYHPLCHNPPVIDIDVYDPRLVWRCGKCSDAPAVASSVESRRVAREPPIDRTRRCETDVSSAMDVAKVARTSQESASSCCHARRRIGSKLSVSRAPNK